MTKPKLPTSTFDENETAQKEVELDNPLKKWLVEYVGEKTKPENDTVTVANIVEVLAKEFPEFLLVVAEENWIRGYRQGIYDVEAGMKIAEEQGHKKSKFKK